MRNWLKVYQQNKKGRDFVVGDLHGCLNEFLDLLAHVNFNPKRDRVFSVGDLVDRGINSKECLQLLFKPWFHAVRGNHEQMLVDYWNDPDANPAYDSQWLDNVSEDEKHIFKQKIEELPHVIQVENDKNPFYVMHAELWDQGILMTNEIISSGLFKDLNQAKAKVLWSRRIIGSHMRNTGETFHHESLYRIFCGHTIVQMPMMVERAIYLDTGAFAPYLDPINGGAEHFGLSLVDAFKLNHWFAPTCPQYRGAVVHMGPISAQLQSLVKSLEPDQDDLAPGIDVDDYLIG